MGRSFIRKSFIDKSYGETGDFMGGEPMPGPTYRGRGPKGYQRSDQRIEEDLSEQLMENPYIDASDVEVEVRDRTVFLRGSVNTKWMKYSIEEIAEEVFGVKDVENRIKLNKLS